MVVTQRKERGQQIAAACGQLGDRRRPAAPGQEPLCPSWRRERPVMDDEEATLEPQSERDCPRTEDGRRPKRPHEELTATSASQRRWNRPPGGSRRSGPAAVLALLRDPDFALVSMTRLRRFPGQPDGLRQPARPRAPGPGSCPRRQVRRKAAGTGRRSLRDRPSPPQLRRSCLLSSRRTGDARVRGEAYVQKRQWRATTSGWQRSGPSETSDAVSVTKRVRR